MGCATFDQRAGFSDVRMAVEERSGKRVAWNLGTDLDAEAAAEVQRLLAGPLTADGAIQVALLNNRSLQATYADLGIAQADVVQAGLLTNPVFGGAVFFPVAGGPAKKVAAPDRRGRSGGKSGAPQHTDGALGRGEHLADRAAFTGAPG
jgi:cobalt-zinc-cadmium efflux system outer membrane protein